MTLFDLSPWAYLAFLIFVVLSWRIETWWHDRRDARDRVIIARRATNIVELMKLMQAPAKTGPAKTVADDE